MPKPKTSKRPAPASKRRERVPSPRRAAHPSTRAARGAASRGGAESDNRFRDFASAAGEWFWETDAEHRYTWFSEEVERITGFPRDWHYGKSRLDLIASGGVDLSQDPWRAHVEAIARREPFHEVRFMRRGPDGERWISSSGVPFHAKDGTFLGYRGSGVDITRQVELERRAARADELLRTAVESLNESIALTDAEDRLVVSNRYFRQLNGNTQVVAPGHRYEDHLRAGIALGNFPQAVGREEQWLRERLEARRRGGTIEIQRQDGIWLQVTDQPLPDGGTITVGLDITLRKQAERALRENEARFRDFAEASGDWFWETDTEDRFVWISDSVQRFAGRTPDAFLGMTRSEAAARAGVDIAGPDWRGTLAAIARREPFRDLRHSRIGGHGRRIWVQVSGVPRFDVAGRFAGYRGAVTNVTAQVENELRAREADERLRAAIENLDESVSVTDIEDRIVVTNRAFRELNGYDAAFLDARPTYEEHMRRVLDRGLIPGARGREEEWLRERLERRRRGGSFEGARGHGTWLNVTEQRLPDGGTVAFARDITERKRAEEALRESEVRFRALVELSSDFYWQTDAEHRFTLREGEILRRVGLPPEADYGKALWELGFLNMSESEWAAHRALLDVRGEFRDLLLGRRASDGRMFWVAMSGRPLFGDDGAFLGYRGVGRGVTAQVEAEQALRTLNAELELRVAERTAELRTAYQELESFSYSVSHDLRAPLRAISGFSAILRDEESARLTPEGVRRLAVIDANAQQMGKLVDALLELVRMSRHAIAGTRLDMCAIARDVCAQLAPDYPQSRIEIGTLPTATGDATLVRQVYVNLVGNALKYSSRGAAPRVEVGAEEGEEGPVYYVRDNGIGFDMAYSDKLFKAFERLHVDPAYEGTGIGLALASLIVHRHGGRIGAESAPGAGATFRFTLGAP